MLGKEALLAMFQNLPTSTMLSALTNAGINVNHGLVDDDCLLDDLQESEAHSWNDYRVPLWAKDNRPKNLLDPNMIVELSPSVTSYGGSGPDADRSGLFTSDILQNAQGGY